VHYLPDHIPGAPLPAAIKHVGLDQPHTIMSDITKAAERFRAHPSYFTGHTSIAISPIVKVEMMLRRLRPRDGQKSNNQEESGGKLYCRSASIDGMGIHARIVFH